MRSLHLTVALTCSVGLLFGACGDSSEITDTSAPSLFGSSLNLERAAAGDVIELVLEPSETLASAPIVTLELATPATMSGGTAGPPYTYTYTVTGDEEEGEVQLRASLTDEAQNTADLGVGLVVLDFTGPMVDEVSFGGAQYLNAGSTGVVSFVVDDAIGHDATATFINSGMLDGTELDFLVTDFGRPAFTYEASGAEPEGSTQVTLELTDVVGNTATSGPFDGFIFDFNAPELGGLPNITLELLSLSAGLTVEVHFTVTEELDRLTVLMRSQNTGDTAELNLVAGTGPHEWIASRQLGNHAPFSVGDWDLEATLVDLADNRSIGLDLGQVELVD